MKEMEQEKVNTWGGRREGSGRKRENPNGAKVQVVITISQDSRTKLKEMAKEKGVTIGTLIESMLP